jgi:hypothetical protein
MLPFNYWLDLKDPALTHLLNPKNVYSLENESIFLGKYQTAASSDSPIFQDTSLEFSSTSPMLSSLRDEINN